MEGFQYRMFTEFTYTVLRVMINSLSIVAAVRLVDGITFEGEWWKIIAVGAIFGLVNAFIKPFVKLFTFPVIILTLGLFTLVINALMLGLTALLSETLNLGLRVEGFWPAVCGAIIISLVSFLLSWLTGAKEIRYYRYDGRGRNDR